MQKTGMKAAKCTLDGNCMLNSVSICLFGNESAKQSADIACYMSRCPTL